LETYSELLKHIPANTGMAFVLVQHLDPKHASILAELLHKTTSMPIREAVNELPVEPNHVYVIPPNTNLAILHGALHLMPRPEVRAKHMPIDYFFRSLAEDQGRQSIGVVLSGTASDGAQGLKALKAEGGITFAQDPISAKYDGMPRAAIAAGAVDFVLPPSGIAEELAQIARHPYIAYTQAPEAIVEAEGDLLKKVFILLRAATGVDFTFYKHSTIKRRIARRMVVLKLDRLGSYLDYLQKNPDEVQRLYDDLLITVTGFFREPDTFEALKQTVFPKIIEDRSAENPIRIWVPGCSTGEEAYSLAIILLEFLDSARVKPPLQIFATDINEKAVEKARHGVYAENIAADVSTTRLARFFTQTETGYQVKKFIRDTCIFAKHDVTRDPPFSKIDIISCRNLLIYLGSILQEKVIPTFHYALRPNGFLLLGASETVGSFTDLFAAVDAKRKIYMRKAAPTRVPFEFTPAEYLPTKIEPGGALGKRQAAVKEFDAQKEADRIVLNRYGPPGVVVNEDMEILQFRGHTGPFLEPAPGRASLNLLDMARAGLGLELRTAIHKARQTELPFSKSDIKIKSDDTYVDINLHVTPIKTPLDQYNFLVLFEQVTPAEAPKAETRAKAAKRLPSEPAREESERLKQELGETKEYLRRMIEEKEASNEELRAANEEIQSSNEELQSINEELETAKEELQSTNEELTTVNDELQKRNVDLSQANDDLSNLFASANIPTVMLSRDLSVRRLTPATEKTLNIVPADIGRHLKDIKLKIDVPDLEKLLTRVVESIEVIQKEVRDNEGRWYLMSLRPYKTTEQRIEGAVLSLVDITQSKQSEIESRLMAAIVRDSNDAITVQDLDGNIKAWNRGAERMYGYSEAEALRMNVEILVPAELRKQAKIHLGKFRGGEAIESQETKRVTRDGRVLDVLLTVTPLVNEKGGLANIATTERDITELQRNIEKLEESKKLDRALNKINTFLSSSLDFGELIDHVLAQGIESMGCESGAIIFREADRWAVQYAHNLAKRWKGKQFNDERAQHLTLIERTHKPLLVTDTRIDDRVDSRLMEELGIRSFLALPLILKERVIGVLAFHYKSANGTFSKAEVDFAQRLAISVSLAAENARLYSEEHKIADTLQKALLTMSAEVKGVDFGHIYKSATVEIAEVGGDFYDLFELTDENVCMVMGDVSGKGLEAAKLTSMIKNTIRVFMYEEASPDAAMTRANIHIRQMTPAHSFTTVFLGVLNTASGTLTYCSAGHPPPIVKRPTGRSSFLPTGGPPLGIFEELHYDERRIKLASGDTLILFTDGATEARRDHDFYGEKRLVKAVKELKSVPAPMLPQAIFDKVYDFADGKLADDIAILCLSLKKIG
jgi:two-component system CheB/CheR fusion protein